MTRSLFQDAGNEAPEPAAEPAAEPARRRIPDPDFRLWRDAEILRYREAREVVAAGLEALDARVGDVLVLYDGGIVADVSELREAEGNAGTRIELEQALLFIRRETRRQAALTADELLEEIRPHVRRLLLEADS